MYKNPKKYTFEIKFNDELNIEQSDLFDKCIGKLIIKTSFKRNPFILPVSILES
jgi:hypothetical protein